MASLGVSEVSEDMSTQDWEKVFLASFNVMCTHRDEFTCWSEHVDVCDESQEGTMGTTSMGAGHLECMCDACPSVTSGMSRMMGTMLGAFVTLTASGDTQAAEDALIESV